MYVRSRLPWVPEVIFFCERSEQATRPSRVNEARTSEAIDILLLQPSEPAKRLIFYSCNTSTGLWNQGGSRWNWNLELLVFEERGKLEYPKKNLSAQGQNQQQIKLNQHMMPGPGIELGYHGGRRALSPPRHPLLPFSIFAFCMRAFSCK